MDIEKNEKTLNNKATRTPLKNGNFNCCTCLQSRATRIDEVKNSQRKQKRKGR